MKGGSSAFTKFPELAEMIQRQREYTSASVTSARGWIRADCRQGSERKGKARPEQKRLQGQAAVKHDGIHRRMVPETGIEPVRAFRPMGF